MGTITKGCSQPKYSRRREKALRHQKDSYTKKLRMLAVVPEAEDNKIMGLTLG